MLPGRSSFVDDPIVAYFVGGRSTFAPSGAVFVPTTAFSALVTTRRPPRLADGTFRASTVGFGLATDWVVCPARTSTLRGPLVLVVLG